MGVLVNNLLTLTLAIPLAGAFLILFIKKEAENTVRWTALISSLAAFLVSVAVFMSFDGTLSGYQLEEKIAWIPQFGVHYHIGVDGLSLLLFMLTTLLTPLAVLGSWQDIDEKVKEFHFLMLFLETAILGVFVSIDMLLFYVFWESVLIPMYFLIGIWGSDRRIYATVKFFIYTMVGSLLMLVAIITLYYQAGSRTFDLQFLAQHTVGGSLQGWLFFAFFLAFAIKVPLFPFHTWLPDAHTEAPMAGSVILAGVLLKLGTYGFVRFGFTLFPEAVADSIPLLCLLAVIGIIYGALMAFAQTDLKRLVAYSSISHLGYVVLGLFVLNIQGMQGGILQMVNHGLSTGALFMLVGFLYRRAHTRKIKDFGGLASKLPIFTTFFAIVTLSSIALPGLNGFVGEILILLGAFKFKWYWGTFAALGMILSAVYMLVMFRKVMFGKLKERNSELKDLTAKEILALIPFIILIVWIGVYPNFFLKKMESSSRMLLKKMNKSQVVSKEIK